MPATHFQKNFGFAKSASIGVELSPADLETINGYALTPLSLDEIYSRKVLLAHNAVDRDRERFPESLLDDFARTLPGKSFLWAHDRRNYIPYGLWFKTTTEEISKEEFLKLTGEEAKLPDGVENVKVLWSWFYELKDGNEKQIANMEAGILRHFSIGFDAKNLIPVRNDFDELLYWEYIGPGEALEGSLVWLGAQNGATAQKAYKDSYLLEHGGTDNPVKTKKDDSMSILKQLGGALGKTFSDTEDTAVQEIKTLMDGKDAEIAELTAKNAKLSPMAAVGEKYQTTLVDEYSRLKGVLGEREDTEEAATSMKGYAKSMGIDFLEMEVKTLRTRADEKFPTDHQLDGHTSDNRDNGEKAANPLIPEKK